MEQKRYTMQDKLKDENYLFAKLTNFENAYPNIKNIIINGIESGYGGISYRDISRTFNKTNLSEYLRCSNSSCQRGGFHVGAEIAKMVRNKETEKEIILLCNGDEGSPKGRIKGRSCVNTFKGTIKIEYNE